MSKKIIPIDYTARDYESIRKNLLEHAKRYYPSTYKDFNKAGFGSLMLDTVSYVGDILSFYLDYQANESFLETASEYQNVIKLSRAMGYNFSASPNSFGLCQFFCLVPALPQDGSPDLRYAPIIKAGSQVSNDAGSIFTLADDVTFLSPTSEITVARTNGTTPTFYAIKASGRVISGITRTVTKTVGSFKKFLKLSIVDNNISEIVSVIDSEGNEYFEVDSLSQECVFVSITNSTYGKQNDFTRNLLRKQAVPRRFTVQHNRGVSTLQFGHGSPLPDISGSVLDPSNVVMRRHAKEYYSDSTFDPTRLTTNDKLGVAPANTIMTIKYKKNEQEFSNASAGSIKNKVSMKVRFDSESNLDAKVVDQIVQGIEVTNEDAIVGDVSLPTVDEIKMRAKGAFSSQSRAVTRQDFVNLAYAMPSKFGMVKRVAVAKDQNSFKRNLNLYVVSQDQAGNLVNANRSIKNNLKIWLSSAKMVNDTLDILDVEIYNFGIDYQISIKRDANKFEVLAKANSRLRDMHTIKKNIGEGIYLGDYYNELNKMPDILDVVRVSIKVINDRGYSLLPFDISFNSSPDGNFIDMPYQNGIFELKYPNKDIRGSIF